MKIKTNFIVIFSVLYAFFTSVSATAALNIPLPQPPSQSFGQGLQFGANLAHQNAMGQMALQRQSLHNRLVQEQVREQAQLENLRRLQLEILKEKLRQLKENR